MKTNTRQTQWIQIGAWLPTVVGLALLAASATAGRASDNRTWDGTSWGAAVPEAVLFHAEDRRRCARPFTWVVIEEVKSGEWGVGGRPFTTADVKALADQTLTLS